LLDPPRRRLPYDFHVGHCVFETTAAPEAFAGVFKRFPDANFGAARYFVAGDRGVSEWLFTGTTSDGKKLEVNGCDGFTFKKDKIAVKNSFFKTRIA
jgi:hypothetical protein